MAKRTYTLKERARKQQETRRRIVEATVALHEEVGPAATTVAEIARRAGVQRVTVYAHFPDDEALFGACSAHWGELHPPPDPEPWAATPDPRRRLHAAVRETHAWYAANEAMLAKVERDAQLLPALARVVQAAGAEYDAAVRDVLASGWGLRGRRAARLRAAIAVALSFGTWRTLARDEGLRDDDAVAVAAGAVEAVAAN